MGLPNPDTCPVNGAELPCSSTKGVERYFLLVTWTNANRPRVAVTPARAKAINAADAPIITASPACSYNRPPSSEPAMIPVWNAVT